MRFVQGGSLTQPIWTCLTLPSPIGAATDERGVELRGAIEACHTNAAGATTCAHLLHWIRLEGDSDGDSDDARLLLDRKENSPRTSRPRHNKP